MTDIYHFTHLDNLATIMQDGRLLSDSECARQKRIATRSGNAEIKQRRLARPIETGVGMGGQVGDYVPFYYAPRSPMLYSIKCGNVPGVDPDQNPIVYFVASAEDFAPPRFVVTDGNAAVALSGHYGSLDDIRTKVDWDVMKAIYWRNTDEDGDKMRRRMAEFLVHRFVDWARIRSIVTRVPTTQQAVIALYKKLNPTHQPPVSVEAGWYY